MNVRYDMRIKVIRFLSTKELNEFILIISKQGFDQNIILTYYINYHISYILLQ